MVVSSVDFRFRSSIGSLKLAFHDADTVTDVLARILADSPDIPAKILARMSVSASWNASFTLATAAWSTWFDE